MTHAQLVEVGAKWLRRKCSVVITEMACCGMEIADVIGWSGGNYSVVIECKASLEDFRRDKDKFFRRYPAEGMGVFRYYMAPKNMICKADLPEKWGLLEVGTKIFETVKPESFHDCHRRREIDLLISAVRRIGASSPKGVSVKFYTFESKCTATLGIEQEEPKP